VGDDGEDGEQQRQLRQALQAGILGVVTRHRLVEGDGLQRPAAGRSGLEVVEQVGAGSGAVTGWRGIHGRGAGCGQVLGHRRDGARWRQRRMEDVPEPGFGAGDRGRRRGHRLAAVRRLQGRILAQPGQHLAGVTGAQGTAAQFGDALLDLGQGGQAELMELLGIQGQGGGVADAAPIGRHPARHIHQPSPLRRPRPGQQLHQQLQIAAQRRADLVPHDPLQRLPPARRPIPAGWWLVAQQRVAVRMGQVVAQLVDDALDQRRHRHQPVGGGGLQPRPVLLDIGREPTAASEEGSGAGPSVIEARAATNSIMAARTCRWRAGWSR
jgi:hypothetical protein